MKIIKKCIQMHEFKLTMVLRVFIWIILFSILALSLNQSCFQHFLAIAYNILHT